jgi:tetratricopeptide (TPR) repeat protein
MSVRQFTRWNRPNALPLILVLSAILSAGGSEVQRAEEHYQHAEYSSVLQILLSYSPKTAEVNALIGKSYYMDGQFKNATKYIEKAVAAEGSNSGYYDWLGKAYGRRAEQSSFVSALPLASNTRECFEKAVALDPVNLEALGDLFEFYLDAPGVVGGGIEKAGVIAARIAQLSVPESHYDHARLAEKRKDFRVAEVEYRRAMEAAPNDIGRMIDLAGFLSQHGRYQESDQLFELANQKEPNSPRVTFARAAAYINSNRSLAQAQSLLTDYREMAHTPNDPPQSDVLRLAQKLR